MAGVGGDSYALPDDFVPLVVFHAIAGAAVLYSMSAVPHRAAGDDTGGASPIVPLGTGTCG